MDRCGILAGGNWIVDRLKFIDTYPAQDALANILYEAQANGGSPFNILVDLAKLQTGLPLAGAGVLGDDADGKWILDRCRAHSIDCSQLHIQPGATTSYTDVMTVRETGRRTFFHQRGANALLEDGHFDFAASRAKHFHLGYLLLLDRLDLPDPEFGTRAARTLHRARHAGLRTSIDVVSEDSQRFAQVVLPALPYIDYCLLNEFELERTTGLPIRLGDRIDCRALRKATRQVLDCGVQQWVIVHFPEGACALGRAKRFHYCGSLLVPPSAIVSAVGAGDAFAAGVLHALHEDADIETALRRGICVAAASLRDSGASDGILPLRECLELEGEFGVRALDLQ